MSNVSISANRRIVLAARPIGAPTASNFRLENQAVPVPGQGQILLRTVYLSLDPYMRGRMSDAPSYAPPVEVGSVMVGSTVSRVEQSQHPDFAVGDWILSQNGWQDYALSDGKGVFNLGAQLEHPSLALGFLGLPGYTAFMVWLYLAHPTAG
jgi:NADPH-dependent curcumin reductase CurA